MYLPCSITNMETLHHEATNTKALVVALENGEIRIYNEKHLVSTIQTNVTYVSIFTNSSRMLLQE